MTGDETYFMASSIQNLIEFSSFIIKYNLTMSNTNTNYSYIFKLKYDGRNIKYIAYLGHIFMTYFLIDSNDDLYLIAPTKDKSDRLVYHSVKKFKDIQVPLYFLTQQNELFRFNDPRGSYVERCPVLVATNVLDFEMSHDMYNGKITIYDKSGIKRHFDDKVVLD